MRDFAARAQSWLDRSAAQTDPAFRLHWDHIRSGKVFPMAAFMEIRTQHPILGFQTGFGAWGRSAEQCYYELCETLTDEALEIYFQFLRDLQQSDVDWTDPEHEYTFFSLVILTDGPVDRALQKRIRRFRCERDRDRANGEFGWSSGRLCVVDLAENQIYASAMAEPLKNRAAAVLN